jgi:hypothetical protein
VPRLSSIAAVAAACAFYAAGAGTLDAATKLPVPGSSAIWATVDVCNTPAHRDVIGLRGSMPGTGDRLQSMFMRFTVEYLGTDGQWHALPRGGSTAFVAVGNARARARQAGQDFTIATAIAHTYLLRGVVNYQWRRGGRVVASATRATTAGHPSGPGSDPSGYSAPVCSMTLKRRGSFVITPVTPNAARRRSSAASLTVHT